MKSHFSCAIAALLVFFATNSSGAGFINGYAKEKIKMRITNLEGEPIRSTRVEYRYLAEFDLGRRFKRPGAIIKIRLKTDEDGMVVFKRRFAVMMARVACPNEAPMIRYTPLGTLLVKTDDGWSPCSRKDLKPKEGARFLEEFIERVD